MKHFHNDSIDPDQTLGGKEETGIITIASPSMALANWNGWSKNFRFIVLLLSQFLPSPTLHTSDALGNTNTGVFPV